MYAFYWFLLHKHITMHGTKTWITVVIVTRLHAAMRRNVGSILCVSKRLVRTAKRADRLRDPPSFLYNGLPGSLSSGLARLRCELTTQFYLFSRWMSGATPLHPHMPSCFAQKQLYLYTYLNYYYYYYYYWGTRCRRWLRQCSKAGRLRVRFPIVLWHNPSGRTMVLGLTQPLTEMSTRNICWWVKAAGA